GSAYSGETPRFGPEYLIPRPFDPRLLISLAPAVAQAAVDSGVATRPVEDMVAYREHLSQFVYRTGLLMKPMFDRARADLKRVVEVLGLDPTVKSLSAMSAVITPKGPFFFCDTHVQEDPTAEQIAESALQAAYRLRLFGITPKVALISHSNFGSVHTPSARKMARALEIMLEMNP